jgi:hypothetical protein
MKTLREFNTWLNEEMNHAEFSIEELKQKTSDIEVIQYADKTLGPQINVQSSYRSVWIIDDQRVLKVARWAQIAVQNKQELKNSKCLGPTYSVIVLDNHPQFIWLIQERVRGLRTDEELVRAFGNAIGTQLPDELEVDGVERSTSELITTVIGNLANNERVWKYEPICKMFEKSDWFNGLIEQLKSCRVSSSDFHYENWGIRPSTGELVLLDLGF